jgi:hypothetical protein
MGGKGIDLGDTVDEYIQLDHSAFNLERKALVNHCFGQRE